MTRLVSFLSVLVVSCAPVAALASTSTPPESTEATQLINWATTTLWPRELVFVRETILPLYEERTGVTVRIINAFGELDELVRLVQAGEVDVFDIKDNPFPAGGETEAAEGEVRDMRYLVELLTPTPLDRFASERPSDSTRINKAIQANRIQSSVWFMPLRGGADPRVLAVTGSPTSTDTDAYFRFIQFMQSKEIQAALIQGPGWVSPREDLQVETVTAILERLSKARTPEEAVFPVGWAFDLVGVPLWQFGPDVLHGEVKYGRLYIAHRLSRL